MRLQIIPKAQLSPDQLQQATMRIFAPEHNIDVGPRFYWNRPEYDNRHLVLFDAESEEFVGTVYCALLGPVAQDFTWWLDSRMRKRGYWRALADDLATYLNAKHGIEKIGFIVFGRQHLEASKAIAQRLTEQIKRTASNRELLSRQSVSDPNRSS